MASCTCARLNRLRAFILASNDYCGESTLPINLQDSSYYHVFANSIDPGQLASQNPADQDQHCLVSIHIDKPGRLWQAAHVCDLTD